MDDALIAEAKPLNDADFMQLHKFLTTSEGEGPDVADIAEKVKTHDLDGVDLLEYIAVCLLKTAYEYRSKYMTLKDGIDEDRVKYLESNG